MNYTNIDGEELFTSPMSDLSIKEETAKKAKFKDLYTLLPKSYKLLFIIGCLCAFSGGFAYPASALLRQMLIDKFDHDDEGYVHEKAIMYAWIFAGVAGISFIANFIHYTCFTLIGKKISCELRWRYIRAILRQDSAWFDGQTIESIPSSVQSNLKDIEIGCGRIIGFVIFSIGSFIFGCGATFAIGWLYFFCILGLLLYVGPLSKMTQSILSKVQSATEKANECGGTQAEETINAICVVKAFRQEKMCSKEFSTHLEKKRSDIMSAIWRYAGAFAWLETVPYISYAYAFLIGGFFISEKIHNSFSGDPYTGGDIFVCGCFVSGLYFLGHSTRNVALMNKGLESAFKVFEIINRVPEINCDSEANIEISKICESIAFNKVEFKYPNAKKNALNGVSFTITKGQTIALVGSSGSGKSTIAKLLERFYDPSSGNVLIDQQDLKSVNLRKYRHLVGYVGQEPCLFNETIRENMLNSYPDATEDNIIKALEKAHAWEFVKNLKGKIDHSVGSVGCLLSGGQKQKIAIARALVRNPQLLIFDEATSALDIQSEKKVQEAIDSIGGESITKVVIAHRLTTIKNADTIYVLEDGKIVEHGNHEKLLQLNQVYARMKRIQDQANRTKEINSLKFQDPDFLKNKEETNNIEDKDIQLSEEIPLRSSSYDSTNPTSEEDLSKNINIFSFVFNETLKYATPQWGIIIIILGAIICPVCFIVFVYPLAKLLITFITNSSGTEVKNDMAIYLSTMLGIGLISSIVQFVSKAMLHWVNTNLAQNVRKSVYDNIIKQPLQFFDAVSHSTGNLTSILSSTVKEFNGAAIETYVFILQGLTGMITGIIFCFIFEWNVGLIMCLICPITFLSFSTTLALQFSFQTNNDEVINSQDKMISDYILNYTTVSSLANEEFMTDRYFKHKEDVGVSEAVFPAIVYAFGFSCYIFCYTFIILVCAHNLKHGHSADDQIMSLLGYSISFLSAIYIMNNPPDFGRAFRAVRKVAALKQYIKEGEPGSSIVNGTANLNDEVISYEIEFHDVWFKYPGSKRSNWVLENFNLKINQDERIGFIGESGCGKSTIVALLMRFYEPQGGYISIGGREIGDFTLDSLRAHFGYVQQEPILFNTTIMENICYGKPHATPEEIESASKKAYCHDFIIERAKDTTSELVVFDEESQDNRFDNLDKGYKALCGSRGSYLSGGQKQRIAIARAIIGNPKVLILDEATSALDEESQKEVQNALDEATEKWASIVIAHRLSTLQKCDRIVTIDRGVIVQDEKLGK
ncbi:unnamed protein product [Moneuplotes crassus]|uniref:Uncharacterized protein n=1 Tax=Euplotes crassus TaxID=5936 RepID=A0AAD1U583_EUPCR|nr:unnamed protein product [Moneuplotes crassus]